MNNKDFAHLHVHTMYSQLDGYGTPEAYAERAKKLGFKHLACTDHGNIDGLIKFQQACEKHDIIPILGVEAYVVKKWKKVKGRGHMCLWIKNQRGFRNLTKLLSKANSPEGFYYKPRMNFSDIMKHRRGLVFGTACLQSFINIDGGLEFFNRLHEKVGDDLYMEIMPHDLEYQVKFNEHVLHIAKKKNVKVIATNDCHYIKRNEHRVQDIMLAIQRKAKMNDPDRFRFEIQGLHLRRAKEMIKALDKFGFYEKKYLTNTLEVAEKCGDFRIKKRDIELPHVPGINPDREDEILFELCQQGFIEIFEHPIEEYPVYYERLVEEFDLIKEKNFTRYFLIVWELCNWCRENKIMIGPGRGSVGGSLLAYLLRITTVDPIKHRLLFSRFINEDRIDYPDIDIDFEDTKRHLVKDHLEAMYGEGNIAGVSSFNRMQARAAIQDVARVFDVPWQEANSFTKQMDDQGDNQIDDAVKNNDDCRQFAKDHPEVIKYAKALEGQVRGYGQHAAALIVSMQKLTRSGRCTLREKDGVTLINWEKDDAEYMGLMKLDALGVKVLSVISLCLDLIKENHDKNIALEKLNLEDSSVLKQISDGHNVGVFQLGTWASNALVKEMGVEKFRHIVDSTALVRPGPYISGMTRQYIERKHGERWAKMHPEYEEMTKETYGLLVFQEQVMEVINRIAGLGYATADKIRKIIGKKRDPREFLAYKQKFMEGCEKVGIFNPREAERFWNGLQQWAKYGFNLSHSVEYAMIAYWCAWLKKYFPTEFICAALTNGAENKKPELIEEAYRLGLTLQLPKCGVNDPIQWKAKGTKLLVPFIEVKGLGAVKAYQAAKLPNPEQSNQKFFNKDDSSVMKHYGALGKLLETIGAYNLSNKTSDEITPEIKKLFKFRIVSNPSLEYKRLYALFGGTIRNTRLDDTLQGASKELKRLNGSMCVKRSFQGHRELFKCRECTLITECKRPVPPSRGIFNIAIIGEAPGPEEDREGRGFIGKSGKDLWKQIGIPREFFHVTNVNKCYPSRSRKPNKEQIVICGSMHLSKELLEIKPCVILAFGNTSLQYFEGRNTGIISMSGQTKWSEYFGCWICYCVHPSAQFHNPDNKQYYQDGIKNFRRVVRALAPMVWSKRK
jgi:DNA polymerase-3 subunit alpha